MRSVGNERLQKLLYGDDASLQSAIARQRVSIAAGLRLVRIPRKGAVGNGECRGTIPRIQQEQSGNKFSTYAEVDVNIDVK